MTQLRTIYQGRVQGVGFRWTAQRISKQFVVCGYVRNRSDGSVELVTQGLEPEVTSFTEELESRFPSEIEQREELWSEPSERHESFEIRF